MAANDRQIEQLASAYVEALGEGPGSRERQAQARAFVARVQARPLKTRQQWLIWLAPAIAVSLLMIGVSLFLTRLQPEALRFQVGETEGWPGMALHASNEAILPVHFSDGSFLGMQPGAKGVVLESSSKQVRVQMSSGELSAQVRPDPQRRRSWSVNAGPYRVRVLGTEFSVAWQHQRLTVEVTRGVVAVRGPDLTEAIRVQSGYRLRAEPGEEPVISELPAPELESAEPKAETTTPAASESLALQPAARGLAPRSLSRRELAEAGKYSQALTGASSEDIATLAAALDEETLWLLARAARHGQQCHGATHALTLFRMRFPDSSRAPVASFLLGRMLVESCNEPSEALHWLQLHLSEDPDGDLAEEALQLLMATQHQLGRRHEAKGTAAQYLREYPGGTFSDLAETILRE